MPTATASNSFTTIFWPVQWLTRMGGIYCSSGGCFWRTNQIELCSGADKCPWSCGHYFYHAHCEKTWPTTDFPHSKCGDGIGMRWIKYAVNLFFYLQFALKFLSFCPTAGVYGFTFFPLGWTSFKKDLNEPAKDPEAINHLVGNCGYIALGLMMLSKFCGAAGVDVMHFIFVSEVYPLK